MRDETATLSADEASNICGETVSQSTGYAPEEQDKPAAADGVQLTLFWRKKRQPLSKTITIENDVLNKEGGGVLSSGEYETITTRGLKGFVGIIRTAK